ncbi:DNA polymerase III subunit gamma/tau [Candidatus Karelsulcia muelleri]
MSKKKNNYQISAIKYRPLDFDNVIGQKHITETLKKAIIKKNIAKSFLFCGPKGVGKTTCARILARKLTNAKANIIELDAASNNSVDDIKDILNKLNYLPIGGKYKIYIMDEVHMLSHSAFNAFLKVLEEPPTHVIFILATTQKNKILPTVLSRCQIYEFKPISMKHLIKYLMKICILENVEYEKDALLLIAENAEGSLRDALSAFDRLKLYSNNKLLRQIVAKQLGILDIQYCLKFTDLIIAKNIFQTFLYFDKVIKKGINRNLFINNLAYHFRNLLVTKSPDTITLFNNNYSDNLKRKLLAQSKTVKTKFLIKAIKICEKTEIFLPKSYNNRLTLEITLIKLLDI